MNDFGILRVQKIKSREELSGRHAHNTRTLTTQNADSRISNIDLIHDASKSTIIEKWDSIYARNGSPKFRKDAVLALELLMTFSPSKIGAISPEKWSTECLRFSEMVFGRENILCAHLHLDEKTPHVHVMLAPFFNRKLCAAHWIDGPKKLRELQDKFYAEVGSKFGLVRGVIGSDRRHIPQKQLYQDSNALQKAAENAIKKLSLDTPEALKIEMPDFSLKLVTETGRADYIREVKRQVFRLWRDAHNRELERFRNLMRPVIEIAKHYPLLNADLLATRQQLQFVMNQNTQNKIEFEKTLAQYRDIPLPLVAERILGFSGRPEGASLIWETDENKLVITGQKFKDFKRSQGGFGGGAIDLVSYLLGCDFSKAMRYLAADFAPLAQGAINSHILRQTEAHMQRALTNPHPLTFGEQLAKRGARDDTKLCKVREYLIRERCIPEILVDDVIARGDLWANKFASCVFAHRTITGELAGCSIRGTTSNFKQTIGNKTSAWFNLGLPLDNNGELIVVESPIDALSLIAIKGLSGQTVVSTAGSSDALPLIELNRPFVLAQDEDSGGALQADMFINSMPEDARHQCKRMPPPHPHKDWNDMLKTMNGRSTGYPTSIKSLPNSMSSNSRSKHQ